MSGWLYEAFLEEGVSDKVNNFLINQARKTRRKMAEKINSMEQPSQEPTEDPKEEKDDKPKYKEIKDFTPQKDKESTNESASYISEILQ